jgi:FAD:protein FMN transferase
MNLYPLECPPRSSHISSIFEKEGVATRSMRAIGTSATVTVTDAGVAEDALGLLAEDLMALDSACSRFRADSELREVELMSNGTHISISPLLFEVLEVACTIAAKTAGTVDPTTGTALDELGYDRDFDEITDTCVNPEFKSQPAPGWWQIRLDPDQRSVAIPTGVHIDVGATAKAFAADRTSQRISKTLGCGVMVNLGGDVALAGSAPRDGWAIGIGTHCTTGFDQVDLVLSVFAGGIATSGTTARTWVHGGRRMHHIVDPWSGEPADPIWSLVSTLAPTCVEANGWSTAAVVWGNDAVGNLAGHGIPARLVRAGGDVVEVGGWPTAADVEQLEKTVL